MLSARAHFSTRRGFLGRLTTLGLAIAAGPLLVGCSEAKRGEVVVLADVAGPGDGGAVKMSALALVYRVQAMEADLLRQGWNKATGRGANAGLPKELDGAVLKLALGTLDAEQAGPALLQLGQFARAAAGHREFLGKALRAAGEVVPKVSGARLTVGRQNFAALLDSLYPVAELTQRAYLGAIAQSNDLRQVAMLASIHSVKTAEVAMLAVMLGTDPNPRRFETDRQSTMNQFSENELEYYREPEQILESLATYVAA